MKDSDIKEKIRTRKAPGRAGASNFPAYYRDSLRWAMMLYARREKLGYDALVDEIEKKLPVSRNVVNKSGERHVTAKVLKGFFKGKETNDQNILIMTEFIDVVLPEYTETFTEKGCSTKFCDFFSKFTLESDVEYITDEGSLLCRPKIAGKISLAEDEGFPIAEAAGLDCRTSCYLNEDRMIFLHTRPLSGTLPGTLYMNIFLVAYENVAQILDIDFEEFKELANLARSENFFILESDKLKPLKKAILNNIQSLSKRPLAYKARGLGIHHVAVEPDYYTGVLVGSNQLVLHFECDPFLPGGGMRLKLMGALKDQNSSILKKEFIHEGDDDEAFDIYKENFSILTFGEIEKTSREPSISKYQSIKMTEFFDKFFWRWV